MLNKNIVFCFTGKCSIPRAEMEAMAIKAGASVTKSVTHKTTILVISNEYRISNKEKRATAIGIPIMTQSTFFKMCQPKTKIIKKTRKVDKVLDKPRRRIMLD